jgi:hypothetical protein
MFLRRFSKECQLFLLSVCAVVFKKHRFWHWDIRQHLMWFCIPAPNSYILMFSGTGSETNKIFDISIVTTLFEPPSIFRIFYFHVSFIFNYECDLQKNSWINLHRTQNKYRHCKGTRGGTCPTLCTTNPIWTDRDKAWTSAVRGRLLTAWATALPSEESWYRWIHNGFSNYTISDYL